MTVLSLKQRFKSADGVRFALWIMIAAQLVAVFFATRPWLRSDSPRYLELAANLASGQFGTMTPEGFRAEAITPPGYPAILAVLLHILHLNVGTVVAIHLAVYLAGAFLLDRLVRADHPAVANLFLLSVAGYVLTPLYVSAVMAEAFALLVLSIVAVAVGRRRSIGLRRVAAAGVVSGIAALIRPDLLLLPVLIGIAAVLAEPRGRRFGRRCALLVAAPLLCAGIVLLPYTAWNAANFGRFSPLPRAGALGTSLYVATWQRKLPLEDLNALYEGRVTARARRAGLDVELIRLNRRIGAPPFTPLWSPMVYRSREVQIRSTDVLFGEALDRIRADPGNYAFHVSANLWNIWNISNYPEAVPPAARTLLAIISAVAAFLGLAGAGLGLFGVSGWPLARGPALVMLYLPAIHMWLHTEARYTAPARLLLLLHAAALLWWLWRRMAGRDVPSVRHPPLAPREA